jgi:hypothetical protein
MKLSPLFCMSRLAGGLKQQQATWIYPFFSPQVPFLDNFLVIWVVAFCTITQRLK